MFCNLKKYSVIIWNFYSLIFIKNQVYGLVAVFFFSCSMTYDASTVFLHLLFLCAFQIYSNPGAGCGFFFLLLFCGCVCACSFLNWCGAGGSACAVFCNLILISCRAFVVFYMFFDRVCETAPAPALLSLPHT